MRPLRLYMRAFGSYVEQEIDFTERTGVFLITGDTGAGKTTIFDAITYALYGESSGGKRNGEMMICRQAPKNISEKTCTMVELEFQYGKENYKVIRIPKQPKYKLDKKTGEYKQLQGDQKAEVKLFIHGTECTMTSKEIDAKIVEIIGLNADQFTQVAMLAQGEFVKLLHADSKERKAIFEKIFDTSIYARIQLKIEEYYKGERQQLENNKLAITDELKGLYCLEESAYKEAFEEAVWTDVKNFRETGVDELLDLIKKVVEESQQALDQQEQEQSRLSLEYDNLGRRIEAAKQINKDIADLEEAIKVQALLEGENPRIQEYEKCLEASNRAKQVTGSYKLYHMRRQEEEACAKELQQGREELQALRGKVKTWEQEYAAVNDLYQKEYDLLQQEIARLQGFEGEYITLNVLEQECASLVADMRKAHERIEGLKKLLPEKKGEQETLEKELAASAGMEHELELLRIQQKDWLEKALDVNRIAAIVLDVAKSEKKLQELQLKKKKAEEDYAHQMELQQNLMEQFIQGQAGRLRQELKLGDVCPVCGNIHEKELPAIESEIISDEELRRGREAEEAARKAVEAVVEEIHQLQNKIEGDKANAKNISEKVPELELEELYIHGFKKSEGLYQKYKNEGLECEKKAKDIEARQARAAQGRQRLEKLKEELQKLEEELSLLVAQKAGKEATYQEKTKQIKELSGKLPYSTREELLKVKEQKARYAAKLKNDKEEKEREFRKAQELYQGKEAACGAMEENLKRLQQALAEHKEEYQNALAENHFATEEEYKKAELSNEQQNSLQAQINEHNKKLQETNTQIKILQDRTANQVPVDEAALNKQRWEISETRDKVQRKIKELVGISQHNQKCQQKIEEAYRKREIMIRRYQIWNTLNETANGKLSKRHIDFQTYVQRKYFNLVVEAANTRLIKMSNKEFILKCTDIEKLATQKEVGLDLSIYNIGLDVEGDIKTLSGGESFMAALSMALGLSDVIKSQVGRIQIDTMFIDEGFGSLSDEVRNQALNLLNDLTGEDRLIGIISHITELKNQIDTKLEIHRTAKGSSASWNIS